MQNSSKQVIEMVVIEPKKITIYENGMNSIHKLNNRSHLQKFCMDYLFIFLEIIMLIFYGLFTTFLDPRWIIDPSLETIFFSHYYPITMDIHLMIFVCFGFLGTFLRKYSWSAVAKNFLMAAWTIQLSILTMGFWNAMTSNDWNNKILLDLVSIIEADLAAASILISFGAVLGKLHVTQYLLMASFASFFNSLMNKLSFKVFKINDI
jgi:ammonium transporter Rh